MEGFKLRSLFLFGFFILLTLQFVSSEENQVDKDAELALESPVEEKRQNTCPGGGNCNGHGRCSGQVCICDPGYRGDDCSFQVTSLVNGIPSPSTVVSSRSWHFYTFQVSGTGGFIVVVNCTAGGDADLYILKDDFPTRTRYTYRDISTSQNFAIDVASADAGTWNFGVYGYLTTTFVITASQSSSCPNLNNCNPPHGTCVGTNVCQCTSNWAGTDCSSPVTTVSLPSTVYGQSVSTGMWIFYKFQLLVGDLLAITLNQTTAGDADLYLKFNAIPGFWNYDYRDVSLSRNVYLAINEPSLGTWYLGVYGFSQANYTLSIASTSGCPSQCSLHGTCRGSNCGCNSGFTGLYCETMSNGLTLSTPVAGYVSDNSWNYYHVSAPSDNDLIIQTTTQTSTPSGDCDVYIKRGANPTRTVFDYRDIGFQRSFNVTIDDPSDSIWYIGVYGYSRCEYSLQALLGPANNNNTFNYPVLNNGDSTHPLDRVSVPNGWAYYQFQTVNTTYVAIDVKEQYTQGSIWVYAAKGRKPDTRTYDYSDQETNSKFHRVYIKFDTPQSDNWIIGVYSNPFVNCNCSALTFGITAWYPPF